MTDFTELSIAGRVATPSDADWDEARLAWNLAADQRPEAVAFVESAEDIAATVRFAVDNDLKVAGQGTGHGAAPLARSTARSWSRPSGCAGSRSTPRRRTARVEAGVLSIELSRGGAAATGSARCPARPPTSASSATRSAAASAGSGAATASPATASRAIELVDAERRAAHGRRRERPRPVLGAARRRGRLRDRRRPPPRPAADRRDLRRRPRLPGRGRRRGGPRLPRLGGGRPGRGQLGRPLPHPAADPRRARADPRPAAADDRRRLHRQPGRGRSGLRAAARDRRADHGHLRMDADRRPLPHPHGPREPGAGNRRRRPGRRS